MKRAGAGFLLVAAGCVMGLIAWQGAATLVAAEAPHTIEGKIAITRSEGLKVLAATFTTPAGEVLQIVADEKGEDLARVMFGRQLKIVGVTFEKDGQKWVKVLDYPDVTETSAHELWRRSRCNACVVEKSAKSAAQPKELLGATPITGRLFPLKAQFQSYARDKRFLWLATDNEILQVDLAARKLVRSYSRKDGLPDGAVYEIASDGETVWILYHGGAAALGIAEGTILDLPQMKSQFARILAGSEGTWIIADTGTFRLKNPGDSPAVFPPLPTAARITHQISDGLWRPFWKQNTGYFLSGAVCIGDRLYIGSFGDVYELAGGAWARIAGQAWELQAAAGRLWMLGTDGLIEYDPAAKAMRTHTPPDIAEGRFAGLVLADGAAWVWTEPKAAPGGRGFIGGGLARMNLADGRWNVFKTINDHPADHVACLSPAADGVWAVTLDGQYRTMAAHPGMTYVKKEMFVTSGFALHGLGKDGRWQSYALPMVKFENRFICGQDGGGEADDIVPQLVTGLSVGGDAIFASTQLFPQRFFSGYWPCVNQIASRRSDVQDWQVGFEHHPEQLNLQGEQPQVLNISNKGVMVLKAVGHDDVLGLFFDAGVPWAVTEGCVGFFDPSKNAWQKVVELPFRFYWKATAALDDGQGLYVGSDRGMVSRLDFQTGRFEPLGVFKDRAISRIVKNDGGGILVATRPAPLGMLPVQLREFQPVVDSDVARFDGRQWTKADAGQLPPSADPGWSVRPIQANEGQAAKSTKGQNTGQKKPALFLRDLGNFVWGPGDAENRPRYYVKEVFSPLFLCSSSDGRRIWMSTFSGLLRLEPSTKDPTR